MPSLNVMMNAFFSSSMAVCAFLAHLLSCVLRQEPVLSQDARLLCLVPVLQGHQVSIRGPLTFLTRLIRPQVPLSGFQRR